MNIHTIKLTANELISEVNLLQHTDWTQEERKERIGVMENALKIINQVLEDICLTDFNSRLYFSAEKGTVEHYMQICIAQVPHQNNEKVFFENTFEPHLLHDVEPKSEQEEINSKMCVIGMILFWVLFILGSFLS